MASMKAASVKPDLVLASGSSTRQAMLRNAGIDFTVALPRADEEALKSELVGEEPARLALALAKAKAMSADGAPAGSIVLGADQVLNLDGMVLGKPSSRADARRQLASLSGKTHRLETAAALVITGEVVWTSMTAAELVVRQLSSGFIESYLDLCGDHILASVGGYQIEGPGAQLFERVTGDHFTILGLPLIELCAELRARRVLPA